MDWKHSCEGWDKGWFFGIFLALGFFWLFLFDAGRLLMQALAENRMEQDGL
jgi:hypothetical protein